MVYTAERGPRMVERTFGDHSVLEGGSGGSRPPLEDFGYYPGYDGITPAQRRSYLEWLAAGRTDADPAQRSLGPLFLFFLRAGAADRSGT